MHCAFLSGMSESLIKDGAARTKAIAKARRLVANGCSLAEAGLAVGLTGRSLDRIAREERWIETRAETRAGALAAAGFDWPTEGERYRARAYQLGLQWFEILEKLPAEDVHRAVATFATLDKAMRAIAGLGDGDGAGRAVFLSPAVSVTFAAQP